MSLTIVMAYYENPGMLGKHLEFWGQYGSAEAGSVRAVIVDDGSPRNPAANVLRGIARPFPIRLFRIEVDIPWNQDGARNLGMKHVDTEWALLTDMDLVLEPRDARLALRFCAEHPSHLPAYWMPGRRTAAGAWKDPHPNSYLIRPRLFWEGGGYDEDFAGCYGSDGNFRRCMRAVASEQTTDAFSLTWYDRSDIPDACTVDYGRKESPYHRSNFPELEAKRRRPPYTAVNHIRFPWHEEAI